MYAEKLSAHVLYLLCAGCDGKQRTKSAGLDVSTVHFFQRVVILFVELERLTCGRKIVEDLQSRACVWDVLCADYKNRNKKSNATGFLAKKNMNTLLLKLRKIIANFKHQFQRKHKKVVASKKKPTWFA